MDNHRIRFTVSQNRPSFLHMAATVYVGGLPPKTSVAQLEDAFAPLRVTHAVIVRSFGFVTFSSADEAATAVERRDVGIGGTPVHAALPRGAAACAASGSGTDGSAARGAALHAHLRRCRGPCGASAPR